MKGLRGKRVIVIGAGFGGLSAAAHLASSGASVTILERESTVGGKAAFLSKDGYIFDAGPTLFTMRELAEDTFAAAGIASDESCRLHRLDSICRYVFANGASFTATHDAEATRASVAEISLRDADAWDSFMEECKEIWRCSGEPYLEAPFDGFLGFMGRVLRRGIKALTLGPRLGTLDQLARRHFQSPEMRDFVGHFATYVGGSPQKASAALAMIAHVELALGGYYPEGGMHALAERLAEAIQERGARLLTGTEVSRIIVDSSGRASGVEVSSASGTTTHEADYVVANVDPLVVTSRLLPKSLRAVAGAEQLKQREPSMSGFIWAFGLAGPVPTQIPQTLLFSANFEDELRTIFDERRIPDSPTVFVSIPTLLDPSRAPEGHHTVFTQLYAPPTADTVDWESEKARLRRVILERLTRHWGSQFASRIRSEVFVTPSDIAKSGSPDGAIYGAAPHGPKATFERPHNRAQGVRGLYYTGGVTHPGGGVTLAMRSGQFTAEILKRDANRNAFIN